MLSRGKSRLLPRVIPCLLLRGHGLVKTVQFAKDTYIGDPINAVKIFNEKEVDELMLLDIDASSKGLSPNIDVIREIASEAFMPLAYGGGISNLDQIEDLFNGGVEKVSINSTAYERPELITKAADIYGSQSIIASVDVRKPLLGGYKLYSKSGKVQQKQNFLDHIRSLEDRGAGEILVNSIDRDGKMSGFDLELIKLASHAVSVPVIAIGGAGTPEHLVEAVNAGASAVSAGSMFVFHGRHKAVLITYPDRNTIKELLNREGQ